jgi:hypothetical protein
MLPSSNNHPQYVGALGDLGSDKEACPVDYKADVATDPEYINETDKEITAQGATAVQVAEDSKEAKINIDGLLRIVFQTLLEECHIPNFTTYTLVADKQLILAQGKPVEFTLYTWKLWRDRHHWASFWKDRYVLVLDSMLEPWLVLRPNNVGQPPRTRNDQWA